jgi:succinate dehydrogenase / fumarate reductase, membrane anchor subunit
MGNGTSIGRVRGLGAAGHGTHHWLLQRFTAIGQFPGAVHLSPASCSCRMPVTRRGGLAFASPVPATILALFLISVFWHARLGLQVLIEDYVHEAGNKFAAIVLLNLYTFAGAGFGLFMRRPPRSGRSCLMASTASTQPAYKIIDHTYDVVVVGAGGSGLRATMGAPKPA